MKKLAIVSSHPIQYNAPWFALLNDVSEIRLKVFYTWEQSKDGKKFDKGFQRQIEWDIPLLQGYEYCFVKNIATRPGTHHFKGLINPSLNRDIEDWGANVILIFGWSFHSHLKCMRYFHGKKKILFRGDSTLIDEKGSLKSLIRKFFLKWVYSHIDVALYVGTNNKNYFVKNGLKPAQLVYTPHAVDNLRFQQNVIELNDNAQQIRENMGFLNGDMVLLFAGKLEKKKNPQLLIHLIHNIKDKKLKLLIVGDGEIEQLLKEMSSNDSRIMFLDFQNQQVMPVIYRVADIFVLPSIGPGETWGLALNEAMACGRPVVATDKVGGAVDLIQNNINGLIIENGNTSEFEELIQKSLLDRSILLKMGIESEKKIRNFSFEKIVTAITREVTMS